jgi:electron transport complex protein RnfG
MSTTVPTSLAPQVTPTAAIIRTLGVVSAVCGLIIVGAYQSTLDAANANRRLALERAVFQVIPTAKSITPYFAMPDRSIVADQGKSEPAAGALKFFAAYDGSGQLAGIAAEGAAKGYADTVRVMFGYAANCQCIVGIGVVSMRETPGIGDKIYTDKDFLANFKALDAKVNADLSGLANAIKTVKHGTKTQPWQIDAIAGATITSRAVGKAINDSAAKLLPTLVPNLDKIRNKS